MVLYKDNLKSGKYEIKSEDFAEQFLNSESQALENAKHGQYIERSLHVFIAFNLNSSFDIQEENNEEDFEKARRIIADKIDYYE